MTFLKIRTSCHLGHAKFVEILLENGADANIEGHDNLTPLEIAQKTGK